MSRNVRAWAALQWWRLRMLAGVGSHVTATLARTVAWTFTRRRAEPVLALLAGNPVARVGARNGYRARAYNPTREDRHCIVRIRGWRDGRPAFGLTWNVVLPPGSAVDRWLASTWEGDDVVVTKAAADVGVAWGLTPAGRWRIEASLDDGEPLRIAGILLR